MTRTGREIAIDIRDVTAAPISSVRKAPKTTIHPVIPASNGRVRKGGFACSASPGEGPRRDPFNFARSDSLPRCHNIGRGYPLALAA